MGRSARNRVGGPVAFMPSDGAFLGSKDLDGLPVTGNGERIRIRILEVVEYPQGEEINGRRAKPFWAAVFERPPKDVLRDVAKRANGWKWERSSKEWRLCNDVVRRLAFRIGNDVSYWPGAVVPLRLEVVEFGGKQVYGVRPVPLTWEADANVHQAAMRAIAMGDYRPPCLAPEMAERFNADFPPTVDFEQRADDSE